MYCKVPVLNSIFVIQSKETKTRKGIINKNLKHQKKSDDNKINSGLRNQRNT